VHPGALYMTKIVEIRLAFYSPKEIIETYDNKAGFHVSVSKKSVRVKATGMD